VGGGFGFGGLYVNAAQQSPQQVSPQMQMISRVMMIGNKTHSKISRTKANMKGV